MKSYVHAQIHAFVMIQGTLYTPLKLTLDISQMFYVDPQDVIIIRIVHFLDNMINQTNLIQCML